MTNADINIRAANPSDAGRLQQLADASPGAPAWTPHTWRQVLDSTADSEQRIVFIAESAAQLVAFGVISRADNSAEIESLAVDAAWRRQGLARNICDQLLAWARAREARQAFLEVRVSNAPARSLYKSLGFRETGLRRNYYRDPGEDAVVMTLAL